MIFKIIKIVRQRFFKFRNKLSLAIIIKRSKKIFSKNNIHYGNNTYGNKFFVQNKGNLRLGNDVYLNSFPNGSSFVAALNTYYPESLISVGYNCRLNGTLINCNENVTIRNDCMFGPGTIIVDNDSHRTSIDYFKRRKKPVSKSILIDENVWVGMNCIILKGIHIGKNAIIAFGSVLTKDVPTNTLFAGNPAKLIKNLKD